MTDINEIFQRDPLKLTTEDMIPLIDKYRAARAQFNLGDKTAGSTKKVKSTAPKGEKLGSIDIDIELDL